MVDPKGHQVLDVALHRRTAISVKLRLAAAQSWAAQRVDGLVVAVRTRVLADCSVNPHSQVALVHVFRQSCHAGRETSLVGCDVPRDAVVCHPAVVDVHVLVACFAVATSDHRVRRLFEQTFCDAVCSVVLAVDVAAEPLPGIHTAATRIAIRRQPVSVGELQLRRVAQAASGSESGETVATVESTSSGWC